MLEQLEIPVEGICLEPQVCEVRLINAVSAMTACMTRQLTCQPELAGSCTPRVCGSTQTSPVPAAQTQETLTAWLLTVTAVVVEEGGTEPGCSHSSQQAMSHL